MTDIGPLVHRLRNTPVRALVSALKKDGFALERETKTGGRICSHTDGKLTVLHYHRGNDALPRKTLHSALSALKWTEDDLKRLGLFS